jgi:hypothetical protein
MTIFYKQREDGSYFGEFHETKPEGWLDELPTITVTYIQSDVDVLLKKVLNKILLYSKALAMGKSIEDDLAYFEEAYTNKYNMCKGNTVDPYNTLYYESLSEGFVTLQEYKDYVIEKYELGKSFYDTALQMSEVMRKLIIVDCSTNNFEKAITRLKLVDDLPTTITVQQVSITFNQVITL